MRNGSSADGLLCAIGPVLANAGAKSAMVVMHRIVIAESFILEIAEELLAPAVAASGHTETEIDDRDSRCLKYRCDEQYAAAECYSEFVTCDKAELRNSAAVHSVRGLRLRLRDHCSR